MDTNCPNCGSTHTQSREIVHKIGTSVGESSGAYGGISFGRRGGSIGWLGKSTRSSFRQSLLAKESAPVPILAPLILIILAFVFGSQNLGFIFILCWALVALVTNQNYKKQWLCKKCGSNFTPSLSPIVTNASTTAEVNKNFANKEILMPQTTTTNIISANSADGKLCSICGSWFPKTEFNYGNKDNRSYCQRCNKEERMAYAQGGVNAARKFKKEKRESWAKPFIKRD